HLRQWRNRCQLQPRCRISDCPDSDGYRCTMTWRSNLCPSHTLCGATILGCAGSANLGCAVTSSKLEAVSGRSTVLTKIRSNHDIEFSKFGDAAEVMTSVCATQWERHNSATTLACANTREAVRRSHKLHVQAPHWTWGGSNPRQDDG